MAGAPAEGGGAVISEESPSRRRQSGCWSAAPPRDPGSRLTRGLARQRGVGARGAAAAGRRAGVCRAAVSRGPASPIPELGLSPAHTKDEAAVAAAAAPAMLCYVTRPDAVLMEVEVEAKANGEDCLNQVRTGAPCRSPEAAVGGARGGAGRRRRWGVRLRRPACAPSFPRP